MIIKQASKLSIVIPTYNRAEFLEHLITTHIALFEKYNINIFISDNGSTDNTFDIVKKLRESHPCISYHKNNKNLGADLNIETALKAPETDYIWLLGDTYCFNEYVLIYILKNLDQGFDHILLNVGNEVETVPGQIYTDQNKLVDDLFWLMTCLSVHIYSRKTISGANFYRYRDCHFLQTGILLEHINKQDFKILWSPEHSVDRMPEINGAKKVTWNDKFFDIWIESRVNFALSLPPGYRLSSKLRGAKRVSAKHDTLSAKQILAFRANSILNLKTAIKHKRALIFCCTPLIYFFLFFCAAIPTKFFSSARYLHRLAKKT